MSNSTPSPFVSVMLCAHNPDPRRLAATLSSLEGQTKPRGEWELIVVDNRSDRPITEYLDLAWHPNARIVVEEALGLAHARSRGYRESKGGLIVHSDDDNILADDYLDAAVRIYLEHPHVGTFGGQLIPRFEIQPRNDLERSFGEERVVDSDRWSNIIDDTRTMPWGAGMCLRRPVVDAYLSQIAKDPRRLVLGRTGRRLLTGEDLDMNYVAVKAGFGTGLFRSLSLEHFIPPDHLSEEHHIRYKGEANGYSVTILKFLHFGQKGPPRQRPSVWFFHTLRRYLRMSSFERRLHRAWDRGVASALADMNKWGWLEPTDRAA